MTMLDFFIPAAHAQAAADTSATGSSPYSFFIMIAVFIAFFYFAILRPQSKRAKEQRDLLNSLEKGDEVATAGGVLGKIIKVADQYVVLSVANNVDIVVQKSAIAMALPKGTLKSMT